MRRYLFPTRVKVWCTSPWTRQNFQCLFMNKYSGLLHDLERWSGTMNIFTQFYHMVLYWNCTFRHIYIVTVGFCWSILNYIYIYIYNSLHLFACFCVFSCRFIGLMNILISKSVFIVFFRDKFLKGGELKSSEGGGETAWNLSSYCRGTCYFGSYA